MSEVTVTVGDLEVVLHPEALEWINQVCTIVEVAMASAMSKRDRHIYTLCTGETPESVALNHFAMACPETGNELEDDLRVIRPDNKHYVLRWIVEYADVYNTYYWNRLKALGAIRWLRKLVAKDVALPAQPCRHPTEHGAECSTCENYGDCIQRSTGRWLLDNFLVARPKSDVVFYRA